MFTGRLARLAQPIPDPVTAVPPTSDDLLAAIANAVGYTEPANRAERRARERLVARSARRT